MSRFWTSLFRRTPMRSFARLDNQGHCLAFKQCTVQPGGAEWVEIDEIRLSWLNHPLPASARVCSRPRGNWVQRSLAA
ncbi:hypothetical protein KC131_16725 [Pseudomonas sp. JQ170]|uniref:hypothetical protein n=1 Tax=unclassified Pseudomonas TaxID=196821 RepID=UPI00264FB2A6|nr:MULTISPECIES: hypothetical protein [unclassified Pseudomonas]MDN7142292.1 hypothetical protein [Pseudomonas sp. JQ170]WRO76807.1 hypothetical protein U9R80_03745 [Pseudomonas sp. 170C]